MKEIIIQSILYLIAIFVFLGFASIYARDHFAPKSKPSVEVTVESIEPEKPLYVITPDREA